MKKILVTGGAGYIGSHTYVELCEAGYEAVVVDNFSNSEKSVVSALEKITNTKVKLYECDCTDLDALRKVFESEGNIDGIIHFAAFKAVGESVRDPYKYYHNNIASTLNVLQIMKERKIDKLVFSSSCTVYGQPDKLPVDENTPLVKAASPYGHTKQINEEMIAQYLETDKSLKTVILRYFNPIGAHPSALIGELPLGKPENLVPFVTQTAAGIREKLTIFGKDYNTSDGTCIRDYIHVEDLARAHVQAIELMNKMQDKNLDILNLGLGKGFTVYEVVQTFEKVTGVPVNYEFGPRRPGDVEQIFSSSEKANKLLNWQCLYGLEDMLKHAWAWQEHLADNQ